jgi:cellulose synthase/poly-beta-1,6-N-acetylglucosamine synthase-like glycosyltransferase
MKPAISVLLPVYNGSAYLLDSLESMLCQSFRNFELIVIDDGSRDDSAQIVQRLGDPRIRFYRQENRGLAATLNRAIELSKAEYLARQDQDDLSLPERLEKQYNYVASHPQCALVGTWANIVSGTERTGRAHRHAAEDHHLKFDLLFDNPFVHSSVMLRKSAVESVGLYSTDSSRQPPEDYELWSRLARRYEVANIPEALHIYREIPTSMSRDGASPFRNRVIDISMENLTWWVGDVDDGSAIQDVAALTHATYGRVNPRVRWKAIVRLVMTAAERIARSYHPHRPDLAARAQMQLAEIKPHYRRCKKLHGIRRSINEFTTALRRLANAG